MCWSIRQYTYYNPNSKARGSPRSLMNEIMDCGVAKD